MLCPVCGGGHHTSWREDARDWQQPAARERYTYATCEDCGARFQALRPVEQDLPLVYFEGYGPYDERGQRHIGLPSSLRLKIAGVAAAAICAAIDAVVPDHVPARLAEFYDPGDDEGVLLDYGCGSSRFLDEARELGWQTVGVDFAPDVTNRVAAAGHRAGLVADGLDVVLAGAEVRVVRMNHVVEHLFHPRDALAEIRDAMAPGGRIHIATPNPTGIASRLFRQRWFALEAPRHAVIYPSATLAAMLRDIGFRDIEILHPVVTKDLLRSWGLRRFARGRLAHADVQALGEDPHRARVLRPVAKAAAVLGLADQFHLLARV